MQKISIAGYDIVVPDEGSIDIYYGRIGAGKTSAGTRNIIRKLKRGQIVYANWKIDWNGYDERDNFWLLLAGSFGLKRHFHRYPKENYHFWNFIDETIDGESYDKYFFKNIHEEKDFTWVLSHLTDCSVDLDEGHIPFDSYEATRMDEKKRTAVFAMRHFDRSLTVYTQRAMSVHTNLRGNTNRFWKCEKLMDFSLFGKRFIRFQITEFQDVTASGIPDETRLRDRNGNETGDYALAVSTERYWGTQKHFNLFNSKYLRNNLEASQPQYAEIYDLTWRERLTRLRERVYAKNK